MISVIVPFYQTEERLFDACVNSIIKDPEAEIELIIADDGSAPEYHRVCDKFSSDPRVKVAHLPHGGVSAARNYGIEAAQGDWITFVDSDDILSDGWYSLLSGFANGRSEDLILFSGCSDTDGELDNNRFFVKENIDYGQKELKYQVMESAVSVGAIPRGFVNHYSLGSPCSKLYRADFLKKNNLRFDTGVTFAEDTLFALNVYNKADHIVYLDAYIYHYIVNRQSVTRKYRPGISEEITYFFNKTKEFLNNNGLFGRLSKGYYTRVNIEILRAMKLEFYNKNNPDPIAEKNRRAAEFLRQEPYKTAMDDSLKGKYGKKRIVVAFMLKHGLYRFAVAAKDLIHK